MCLCLLRRDTDRPPEKVKEAADTQRDRRSSGKEPHTTRRETLLSSVNGGSSKLSGSGWCGRNQTGAKKNSPGALVTGEALVSKKISNSLTRSRPSSSVFVQRASVSRRVTSGQTTAIV